MKVSVDTKDLARDVRNAQAVYGYTVDRAIETVLSRYTMQPADRDALKAQVKKDLRRVRTVKPRGQTRLTDGRIERRGYSSQDLAAGAECEDRAEETAAYMAS